MSQIFSFREVIDLWPTREVLGAEIGLPPNSVSKWWQRDSIPAEWWTALLGLERARNACLTADLLADLASKRETAA